LRSAFHRARVHTTYFDWLAICWATFVFFHWLSLVFFSLLAPARFFLLSSGLRRGLDGRAHAVEHAVEQMIVQRAQLAGVLGPHPVRHGTHGQQQ
jgi:hypothetical protein